MILLFPEERYRVEVSILKKQLVLLNEIASLSTKKTDDSQADNLPNGDTVGNSGTRKQIELSEEKEDRELHEEGHSVSVLGNNAFTEVYSFIVVKTIILFIYWVRHFHLISC
ncbi:MAG: hypothetical protein ACI8RD_002263 [Bacillariaceae sp.]|jgi:hypothetical protein